MMNQGFKIHKTAVFLEVNLNRIIAQQGRSEVVDITMIYDQPITLISEILQSFPTRNETIQHKMERLLRCYDTYHSKLLMQLEDSVCLRLCEDLEGLLQEMRIS